MIQKVQLKNPGCQFCRYYLPSFRVNFQKTTCACLINARIIFQSKNSSPHPRKWRWCNCQYALEKNKTQYCSDFKVRSFFYDLTIKFKLHIYKAGKQLSPTFAREKWWIT